jgi:hypothetical protein
LAGAVTNKYWPRQFDELATDPIPATFINEPPLADNVGVLVLPKARSLPALIAQALSDAEALIDRLELVGVDVAASGRPLIRDLYVQCRKQREILAAVLRLELE